MRDVTLSRPVTDSQGNTLVVTAVLHIEDNPGGLGRAPLGVAPLGGA